jgi:hypothetical protein
MPTSASDNANLPTEAGAKVPSSHGLLHTRAMALNAGYLRVGGR